MQYPDYFTNKDIMEFEYEYNVYLDQEFQLNLELQLAAQADLEVQQLEDLEFQDTLSYRELEAA